MASIYKLPSGLWRVQIARAGCRESQTFDTKKAGELWAAKREAELMAGKRGGIPKHTVSEALEKYKLEVSPKKRGERWEALRLDAYKREKWANKLLTDLSSADLAKWRDTRLTGVSSSAVQRDFNLLKNVFKIARREWKWLDHDPFEGVEPPGENPPRTRRWKWGEVKKICRQLGHVPRKRPETKSQEVAFALLVALRTAMRAGEILSLCDKRVDLVKCVARVPHKTQHLTGQMRTVPMQKKAARLLSLVAGRGDYFTVKSGSLDTLFRKAKKRAGIEDLHFHDSRAEALTRLSKKVDLMTLARISGHADTGILFRVYYRESAEDIAARLD